ncbi:MAG: LacI family transcriptional regulator [Sphaerochaetaceae bacterium]|nr:LacI family transcriptional regulator [Sphaerochaetaceae bacterium]
MGHVTIKTIAREMGLSISAVSKALNNYPDINENTKEAVIQKALEMGYSPNMIARNLVKSTSNSIGVVVRDTSTIYGELLKPLSEAALKKNLTIVMGDSNRSKERELSHIKSMMASRVMGLIIAPVDSDVTEIEKTISSGFPVVYLGGHVSKPRRNQVMVDSEHGVKLAIDYLYSLGHRNIALVTDAKSTESTKLKIDSYIKEMEKHNLNPAIFTDTTDDGNLVAAGYRQIERIFQTNEKYTALFAVKDMLAAGLMQALKDRNISVPDDISVIGYDGADVSSYPMINLTTIATPKEKIAELLVDIILTQANGETYREPRQYFTEPVLVQRSSCKRILNP